MISVFRLEIQFDFQLSVIVSLITDISPEKNHQSTTSYDN